ncbi:MAG: aryl-sulfate sulfohydrolase [Pirellula sp.]|nr:aryl-sulfate sulfohydrolase [Pirellula sp.]
MHGRNFLTRWKLGHWAVCLSGIAFCCAGEAHVAEAAEAAGRPNIVFILADDLGPTDPACYGSGFYKTPNIDRLAAEGMKFTDGYTCGPNCQPTRAALMSGQYGPRTGVYTVGGSDRFDSSKRPLVPVDNVTSLPTKIVTVAEALHAAGYKTGMFGKWHLGDDEAHHPSQQGFDEAVVSMGKHFGFGTKPKVEVPKDTYLADFLTARAVDFIDRHQKEPFFLYVPHFGVHSPFQAKQELIAKFAGKPAVGGHHDPTYAAMIASVDESVGRIIAKLDELKLSENTLVIFSSDNGGVGGYDREGITKAGGITDNAPYRGGKGMLYEGGVRCAYLFRRPGKVAAGTTCDEPICSVDLYPTLLELAGASPPSATQPLDGVSYVSLLHGAGEGKLPREAIYWHFPGYLGAGADSWRTTPVGAIRVGDFKLLEFFEDDRLELYNLRDDVGQKTNLATSMPEKTKELHDRLVAWRTEVKAPMPKKRDLSKAGDDDKPAGAKKKKKRNKAQATDE